jgi:molybdenum cofactor cytidylyltransferase
MDQYTDNKIAGIILAAGASSRMGQPKVLLEWQGETLIHRVARIASSAGLKPVSVVAGALEQQIKQTLSDLETQLIPNPNWAAGQSTSVRAGIQALPADTQAVLFLLGDQPFVTVELIQKLVETYQKTRPVILAPFVNQKRINPVIFDRSAFPHLLELHGDAGARSLFIQFPPAVMPWNDDKAAFDIDTPEDYEKLIHTAE